MQSQIENIFPYIPHRPPMLMVKEILSATQEAIEISTAIDADCVLLDENNFLEHSAYVEIMAQAFALGEGYLHKENPIELGYLATIRNFSIYKEIRLGAKLVAKVKPLTSMNGVIVVFGELFEDDVLLAQAQFSVYSPSYVDR